MLRQNYLCMDMYAIIDVETTGGRPQSDKITEIAIFIHDGQQLACFSSVVKAKEYLTHLTADHHQHT